MTEQWYTSGLAYMKVAEDDDGVGRACLDAAAQHMKDLGVPEDKIGNDPLLDLTIWGMALYWYDHREEIGSDKSLPAGVRPLVTGYKIAYGH